MHSVSCAGEPAALSGGSSASFYHAATAGSDQRASANNNAPEAAIAQDIMGNTFAHRIDQCMSKFLAMIAHDLRNPLSAVTTRAESIETAIATRLADPGGADARAIVDDVAKAASAILRASEHMDQMISDLLEAARTRATGFKLRLVEHDLSETVLATVRYFEAQAQSKQIRITNCLDRPVIV